jgi:hypothetical protein
MTQSNGTKRHTDREMDIPYGGIKTLSVHKLDEIIKYIPLFSKNIETTSFLEKHGEEVARRTFYNLTSKKREVRELAYEVLDSIDDKYWAVVGVGLGLCSDDEKLRETTISLFKNSNISPESLDMLTTGYLNGEAKEVDEILSYYWNFRKIK